MEILGVVASLVQLVDAALGVAKTSKELYKSYRDAPESSKSSENQRRLLQSVVDQYTHLRPRLDLQGSGSDSLPLDARQAVATALLQVSEALEHLKTALNYREDNHTTPSSRIRWAFSDKKAVKEAQEQLQIAKSTLTNVLLLLSLRFSALHQCTLQELTASYHVLERHVSETSNADRLLKQPCGQFTTALQGDATELTASMMLPGSSQARGAVDHPHHNFTKIPPDLQSSIILDPTAKASRTSFVKSDSISCLLSSITDCNRDVYFLSLKARLPWFLGSRILVLEWQIRHYVSSWLNLTILPGYIGLSNYVCKDSLIAQACFKGDEIMARKVF